MDRQIEIRELLGGYHCQYTMELGDEGHGLSLVDMLCSPGAKDISSGEDEIVALAEYLDDSLSDDGELRAENHALTAQRDALRGALEHYADELNWGFSDGQEPPRFNDWYSPVDENMRYRKAHGYDIAREALAKAAGEGK